MPPEPARALYGDTLFQGKRFHRLRRYHRAAARHGDADLAVDPTGGWLAPFHPGWPLYTSKKKHTHLTLPTTRLV
ncbi:hypothetical protein C6361_36660 [Plantactinospora sp. BC1]|nr:hypothetical protein C6361_36660 [Plantactinospora sp. BC1]